MKIERPPILHVVIAVVVSLFLTSQLSWYQREQGRLTLTPDGIACGDITVTSERRLLTLQPAGRYHVANRHVDVDVRLSHGSLDGELEILRGDRVVRSVEFRVEAPSRSQLDLGWWFTRTRVSPVALRDSLYCATPDSTWVVPPPRLVE